LCGIEGYYVAKCSAGDAASVAFKAIVEDSVNTVLEKRVSVMIRFLQINLGHSEVTQDVMMKKTTEIEAKIKFGIRDSDACIICGAKGDNAEYAVMKYDAWSNCRRDTCLTLCVEELAVENIVNILLKP